MKNCKTIQRKDYMYVARKGVIIIKTFANQDKLQKFPVPPITSTHPKLLKWIEPLVHKEQFSITTSIANDFFKKSGDAEKLQTKLKALKEQTDGSWLTQFWDNHYLKYRGSLPTGMHFNILVDRPQLKKRLSTAEIAGKASFLVAEYYHKIIDQEIKPVTLKGIPQDMEQYKKFFRSVRVPQVERDQFKVAEFDKNNNFVIFIYKNNMYKVPVTNASGQLYSSEKLIALINQILASDEEDGLNVGIYTTAEREEAAKIYTNLKLSNINACNIEAIANALIVISIDEESNDAEEAVAGLMLNGRSKYFDKTIQLVITKRGRIGYSIEHTAVDGTTIFAVISYVNEGLANELEEVVQTRELPKVEQLTWDISEELQTTLLKLEQENEARKTSYHVEAMVPQDFGADAIKQMRISPDAFFHIALQIAQYRTFGAFNSVYEPVSIRHYKEGRTECARATSMEKKAVVRAIESNQTKAEIYALMEQASAAHSARIVDARNGLGVERHMFGLEQAYLEYGEQLGMSTYPAIFNDLGYKSLRKDFLSTSGMAYDNVHSRVFAPVVEGGFGIAYILLADTITLNISCRSSEQAEAERLGKSIREALNELKEIAETVIYTQNE